MPRRRTLRRNDLATPATLLTPIECPGSQPEDDPMSPSQHHQPRKPTTPSSTVNSCLVDTCGASTTIDDSKRQSYSRSHSSQPRHSGHHAPSHDAKPMRTNRVMPVARVRGPAHSKRRLSLEASAPTIQSSMSSNASSISCHNSELSIVDGAGGFQKPCLSPASCHQKPSEPTSRLERPINLRTAPVATLRRSSARPTI